MEYKGYRLTEEKNRLIIENVRDFSPENTFECGQCFRWNRQNDGTYIGVAMGMAVRLGYERGTMVLDNATAEDFIRTWYDYFDLGRDYGAARELLTKDEHMAEAWKYGAGMRLLRQDPWETTISFIISANNNMSRIKGIVAAIADADGLEISLEGRICHDFPEIRALARRSAEGLDFCKCGYRDRYIAGASAMLQEGLVDLALLSGMDTASARKELMRLPGVGAKVADCILLFSGIKGDVFPTDVWVKRVMETLYFKREASLKEIADFAAVYFGDLSGIAQQILFYYAREQKIGIK